MQQRNTQKMFYRNLKNVLPFLQKSNIFSHYPKLRLFPLLLQQSIERKEQMPIPNQHLSTARLIRETTRISSKGAMENQAKSLEHELAREMVIQYKDIIKALAKV